MRSNARYHRQLDLINVEKLKETHITVIGVGALGSFSTLMLAKMGVEHIRVYDDDAIEEHNFPNQFYRNEDLGKKKVEALRDLIQSFEGLRIETIDKKFEETDELSGVVIAAVDNMAARQIVWNAVKLNPSVDRFIDTRAAGNLAEIYFVDPCDLKQVAQYEANLFPDDEGMQVPCTAKMTTYIAGAIGSYVAATMACHVNKTPVPFQRIFDLTNSIILHDAIEHRD